MENNNEQIVDVNLSYHSYARTSTDFGSILSKILCDFESKNDLYSGYLDGGVDKCNAFFKQIHQMGFPFVIRTSLQKKISDMPRIFFKFQKENFNIKARGAPFCVLAHLQMDCVSGPKKKTKPNPGHHHHITPILKERKWKKLNCPAKLNVRVMRFFPEYSVKTGATMQTRKHTMNCLKDAYRDPEKTIFFYDRVYIVISKETTHLHPPYLNFRKNTKKLTKKQEEEKIREMFEKIHKEREKIRELSQNMIDTSSNVSNDRVLKSVSAELEKLLEILNKSASNDKSSNYSTDKKVSLVPKCNDLIQTALSQAEVFPSNNAVKNREPSLELPQDNIPSTTLILSEHEKTLSDPPPSNQTPQIAYLMQSASETPILYEIVSFIQMPLEFGTVETIQQPSQKDLKIPMKLQEITEKTQKKMNKTRQSLIKYAPKIIEE